MTTGAHGSLYYGDNLEILRRYILDEGVDLIYLGRPFKSEDVYLRSLRVSRPGSSAGWPRP
jgi:hypothetical protein